MSHLEDIAKSMGISSDELFSGKYGDNYDEILDNLMMKKLNESYASEDSLVKIEDDDDKDTKVTVLDEWENETDPDVGGDVKGLDQDQKNVEESWSKKSFNQKVEALETIGFRQGKALRLASLAYEDFSEELQDAIEEQDLIQQSKNDEIKAGIDNDHIENNESELKDRYKCSVCDNSFDELFYSQSGDQGMCPFCGSTYIDEFNVETFVDYNNVGESKTARTKYECEFCNSGFKSNESLSIHYNDIHAVPPTPIEGYENWKEVANNLYKKELEKRKKYGGEANGDEEGTSDGAKKGWLTRKRGGSQTEEPKSTTKKQTKTNTNLNKVKDKLLSKLDSGSKNYVKVANLDGYPQNSSQLRNVPTGVKGVIMKSHLKDSYDGANFSVRKDGYNSLNVSWTGGDGGYPYGAQGITELYSDRGSTNIQVDYFDVDNYVSQMSDERKDKHEKDPWYVADSRESRFGNWIYTVMNQDWSNYREKFDGHIDLSVTKTMADHILNEPEVTGFNNVEYSDFADLKKEFLEEEKRTGGGSKAKDLPKSSSASSYKQQYMGEDPSKPSEIPYDPNTGEELPVSSFNPNDTKYRKPKETDTVSDMAKAYGDMMARKKNSDQPMWDGGESYATEDDYKYDFDELTSLAQDKIEDEGVTQKEWNETPEEERKELEKEIEEAYNSSDLVCPECGDMTTNDKEFNDHLASHRFDEGDY